MGYDAFISYGHAGDAGLAPALAAGLQRLAKPWWRRRALQVFCDTSTLSANPALWSSIADSMSQSSYLVVLASADSAQSPWVAREIEYWRATKEPGHILLALTDGALVWDAASGDFNAEQSTALSPALLGAFTEEPLYVDLSGMQEDASLTLRNPRFMDAVADLAAPIRGVAKDELVGEDLRQHRRTLYVAWGAAFAVMILAIASIVGAVIARDKANEAQRKAAEALSATTSRDQARRQAKAATAKRDKANAQRRKADAATAIARSEGAKAKGDADTARKDRDSATADAETAKSDRAQAEQDAKASQAEADASARLADQSAAEALAAGQEAARQQALASVAEDNAANAAAAQNTAEAATAEAVRQADAADAAAADAIAAEHQAVIDRALAELAAAQARADASDSQAVAQASGLAAASQQPDLVDGALDTSLLLALASTVVEPANAGVSAAAVAPTAAAPTAAARDALAHAALHARDGLRNHLQFAHHDGPLEMRTSAMGTRGGQRVVAAAETSHAIEIGEQPDRLFVWLDALNPADRAVELSAGQPLGCVRELFLVAGAHRLVSVEDPLGCLNTNQDPSFGGDFVDRTVRIWNLDSPGTPPEQFTGLSALSESPVAMNHDGSLVAIQQPGGTRVFDFPAPGSEQVSGFYLKSAIFGVESIVDDGNYLVGVAIDIGDPTQTVGATWSRATGDVLTFNAVFDSSIAMDPDGAVLAASIGQFIGLFDPATGTLLDAVDAGAGNTICSFTLASSGLLAVTFDPGGQCSTAVQVAAFDWTQPANGPAWTPLSLGGSQLTGRVRTSPQGRWITVERLTGAPDDPATRPIRIVIDAATGDRRADLEGEIVQFGQTDERYVVTQERAADPDTDGFKIRVVAWDLQHSPAAPVLTEADADVTPSRDGRSVAVFPTALPVLGNDSPVVLWPLDPIGLAVGVRELPSPSGAIHAVAFDTDGVLVGFGATSAGIVWDPSRRPYDTIDTVAPSGLSAANPCRSDGADARVSATSPWDARLRAISPDGTGLVLRSIDPDHPGTSPVDVGVGLTLPPGSRISYLSFTRGGNFLLVNLFRPGDAVTVANPCKLAGSLVIDVTAAGGVPAAGVIRSFPEEAIGSSGDGSRISFLSLDASLSPRRSRVLVRDAANLDAPAGWIVDTSALGEDDEPNSDNLYALDWHGDRLAGTNTSAKALVWDRAQTAPLHTYELASQPSATVSKQGVAWANDGRLALKWSDDILRLFDVNRQSAAPIATKRLSPKAALRLRFSDDGTLLLADGIYVLDGHSLNSIGPRLHPESWNNFTDFGTVETFFTHDGNYVVAQRTDGSEVARWPVGLDLLRAEACTKAGRNLTVAEAELFQVTDPNSLCSAYGPDGA